MIIKDVIQGSQGWNDLRAQHHTASEAPAMAGVSKYTSRSELLKQKYSGVSPEVTGAQQGLFDKGHASEAKARPIAEGIIGEDLYPVTGVSEEYPELLASFDGCTMLEDVIFEHKLWNQELAAAVNAGDLPEHYKVQMDQQLLVSGAEKCLFMCSDGTRDNCAWMIYRPDPKRFESLLAGWKQFADDLANYQPTEQKVAAEGEAPDQLPALRIDLTGAVTASNLPDFKAHALRVIESINTALVTDKDFADADKTIKFLDKGEKQLEGSKKAALEQTASIDELFRTIDELKAKMRDKRLALNKLVTAEKQNRRVQIQRDAEKAFADWLGKLDSPVTPSHTLDVAGAMKGKKTISTLEAAADDEVARAKIEATKDAKRLTSNAKLLDEQSDGFAFLFADKAQLIQKAADDLAATIKARIAEHKEAEQKRQDAEREKIRQEEAARAEKEADDRLQARLHPEPLIENQVRAEDRAAPRTGGIDTSRINAAAANFQRGSEVAQPEQVTISRKEYDQLLRAQATLDALEAAGVDNWSGYGDAMEQLAAA